MPISHPNDDAFDALLEGDLPFTTGVQVALTQADGTRWTGAAGFADLDRGIGYAPCTRGPVASISKLITAVMVLRAQEQGLLDVDDPLRDYLPTATLDDLANAAPATLRQLLNHTSGIPDYLTLAQALRSLNEPFLLETQREKLAYARGLPATFPVGTDYAYSNTNFTLLGLVLEAVYAQPLTAVVQTQIVEPLTLPSLAMGAEADPIPDNVARPYLALAGGKYQNVIASAVADAATGDGGILATMDELQTVARATFDGTLISAASLATMLASPTVLTAGESDFDYWPDEAYGLGVTRFNTPIGVAYGHTGSTSAYNSKLLYFPETGACFAIIRNGIDLGNVEASLDRDRLTTEAFLEYLR